MAGKGRASVSELYPEVECRNGLSGQAWVRDHLGFREVHRSWTNWTACKYRGGYQVCFHAAPPHCARHHVAWQAHPKATQRTTLLGTREAPERPERTNWTACEAPGRQEKTNWTAWEAPERHQGDQKCKELSSQITASIFWKKNAAQKYRHRF